MAELYVAIDVDTDGPIPGPHSLLSFGAAAYQADTVLVDTFSANLAELPGAAPEPATAAWWREQPAAWAACRRDPEDPAAVMPRFRGWLEALPGEPVFVGYPAAFDFLFIYWYLMRFAGHSPFAHAALDIKTYAMAMLGTGYRDITKRSLPRRWFTRPRPEHAALDHAVEEGALFVAMLRENRAHGGTGAPAPKPRRQRAPTSRPKR